MKTVTKYSLDNLSMIMPILSESEQNVMVGGTEYYYFTGSGLDQKIMYSGSVSDGYNDVLFIQDPNAGATRENGYKPNLSESQLEDLCQSRVVSGSANITAQHFPDPDQVGQYDPETGTISISIEKLTSAYASGGNFREVLSIMNHEIAHQGIRALVDQKFVAAFGEQWWVNHKERGVAFSALVEYVAYSAEPTFADYAYLSTAEQHNICTSATDYLNDFGNFRLGSEKASYNQIWNDVNGSQLVNVATTFVFNNRVF